MTSKPQEMKELEELILEALAQCTIGGLAAHQIGDLLRAYTSTQCNAALDKLVDNGKISRMKYIEAYPDHVDFLFPDEYVYGVKDDK